jgi:hypothetical protein
MHWTPLTCEMMSGRQGTLGHAYSHIQGGHARSNVRRFNIQRRALHPIHIEIVDVMFFPHAHLLMLNGN